MKGERLTAYDCVVALFIARLTNKGHRTATGKKHVFPTAAIANQCPMAPGNQCELARNTTRLAVRCH